MTAFGILLVVSLFIPIGVLYMLDEVAGLFEDIAGLFR